jgi:hypothetical protein
MGFAIDKAYVNADATAISQCSVLAAAYELAAQGTSYTLTFRQNVNFGLYFTYKLIIPSPLRLYRTLKHDACCNAEAKGTLLSKTKRR